MGGQKSMMLLAESLDRSIYEQEFIVPEEGELFEYIRSKGFECHVLKFTDLLNGNIFKAWKSVGELRRLVKERGIDIVHADGERDALIAGLATFGKKAKSIWHVRVTNQSKHDRYINLFSDRIIAISEGAARRVGSKKCEVIFNGVDTEKFVPRDKEATKNELGYDADKCTVLFVGQMARHKGIFDILDAANILETDYEFVFCGKFPDAETEDSFAEKVGELGLGNIRFEGQVSDIERYMAAADFLLLASQEGTEGMGRVIFEAMACGTVPIGSDISGVREAISSDTGVLVPEGSPQAIAKAIEDLRADKEKYQDLAKAGRERAIKVFGKEKHALEVSKVYQDLIANK